MTKPGGVYDEVCRVFNDATWMKTTQETGAELMLYQAGVAYHPIDRWGADGKSICIRFSC